MLIQVPDRTENSRHVLHAQCLRHVCFVTALAETKVILPWHVMSNVWKWINSKVVIPVLNLDEPHPPILNSPLYHFCALANLHTPAWLQSPLSQKPMAVNSLQGLLDCQWTSGSWFNRFKSWAVFHKYWIKYFKKLDLLELLQCKENKNWLYA